LEHKKDPDFEKEFDFMFTFNSNPRAWKFMFSKIRVSKE